MSSDEFQLHDFCLKGSIEDIKNELKTTDADQINAYNKHGDAPIHLAMQRTAGDVIEVIDLLIQNGADLNIQTINEGDTPMHMIMQLVDPKKGEDLVVKLLQKGADFEIRNKKLRSPYDLAVNHGYYSLLDVLSGETPLSEIRKDSSNLTEEQHSNNLMSAISDGDMNAIEDTLIKADATYINADGDGLIHSLIKSSSETLDKKEVLLMLISNGCQINLTDKDGLDAATLAEKHGREDLAAVLRSVQMELNMNKLGSIEEGPEESKESEMKEEESAEKKQAENGPQKDGTKEKKEEEVERVEKNNDKNDSEEDGKGPAEEDKGEGPHEEQK